MKFFRLTAEGRDALCCCHESQPFKFGGSGSLESVGNALPVDGADCRRPAGDLPVPRFGRRNAQSLSATGPGSTGISRAGFVDGRFTGGVALGSGRGHSRAGRVESLCRGGDPSSRQAQLVFGCVGCAGDSLPGQRGIKTSSTKQELSFGSVAAWNFPAKPEDQGMVMDGQAGGPDFHRQGVAVDAGEGAFHGKPPGFQRGREFSQK